MAATTIHSFHDSLTELELKIDEWFMAWRREYQYGEDEDHDPYSHGSPLEKIARLRFKQKLVDPD